MISVDTEVSSSDNIVDDSHRFMAQCNTTFQ